MYVDLYRFVFKQWFDLLESACKGLFNGIFIFTQLTVFGAFQKFIKRLILNISSNISMILWSLLAVTSGQRYTLITTRFSV